jgi:hypothetical protein
VSDGLLEQLVALVADEIVLRLGPTLPTSAPPAAEEPWHLLGVEEAGARLGRSTRWVRERAKRGELPFVRLDGGALAFDLDDLRAFARARRVPGAEGDPLADRLQPVSETRSDGRSRDGQRVGNRRVER